MIEQSIETIEFGGTEISKKDIREYISKVEKAMENGEKIDIPLAHHFSQDIYAREMTVPKGTMLVGKIHRFKNMNILSKGEVSILSIDGCLRVKAPYTFVASPGSKRLFFMHEETVWTTIHGTAETDLEKIEEKFIARNYLELLPHEELKILTAEDKPCHG